jgi:hypothetical protein
VTSTESLIETRSLQALIADMKIGFCVREMIGHRGHEVITIRILGALGLGASCSPFLHHDQSVSCTPRWGVSWSGKRTGRFTR